MADPVRRDNFVRGSNNRARAGAMPEGYVRELINLDPLPGGELALRTGYTQVYASTAVRGALALRDKLLIADGTDLVEFDTASNSSRVLRAIAGAGAFVGAEFNGELFFCTANECLRYDGANVRPWGVSTPAYQPPPAVSAGGALRAAAYKYATTFVDASGHEGGASTPGAFVISTEQSVAQFSLPTPPAGGRVRLYCSFGDSTELYLQAERSGAGVVALSVVRTDTASLATQGAKPPAPGEFITAHHGVLLLASGRSVWVTHPLRPHLVFPARGFFQYPTDVTGLLGVEGGVYVLTDRAYWLSDVEGGQPVQIVANDAEPVRGTGVIVPSPDGDNTRRSALWMTQYGAVLGDATGTARFLTRSAYVPTITARGASGVIEHDGNQLAVTSMRGTPRGSAVTAGDYVDAEIIYP